MNTIHEHFMQEAIREAKKANPNDTDPNPRVGCIITHNDEIIARGYHKKNGGPHAEINAINNLPLPTPSNTKIYVTLEPCSTHGRTGACTEAIIKVGIKEAYIGAIDPNPDHNGNGIKALEKSGMSVTAGILKEECEELNPDFNARMKSLKQS